MSCSPPQTVSKYVPKCVHIRFQNRQALRASGDLRYVIKSHHVTAGIHGNMICHIAGFHRCPLGVFGNHGSVDMFCQESPISPKFRPQPNPIISIDVVSAFFLSSVVGYKSGSGEFTPDLCLRGTVGTIFLPCICQLSVTRRADMFSHQVIVKNKSFLLPALVVCQAVMECSGLLLSQQSHDPGHRLTVILQSFPAHSNPCQMNSDLPFKQRQKTLLCLPLYIFQNPLRILRVWQKQVELSSCQHQDMILGQSKPVNHILGNGRHCHIHIKGSCPQTLGHAGFIDIGHREHIILYS